MRRAPIFLNSSIVIVDQIFMFKTSVTVGLKVVPPPRQQNLTAWLQKMREKPNMTLTQHDNLEGQDRKWM